jgi:predicted transcriptional regulator
MANITVKDLSAYSDSGTFIRDLSEAELDLQGGGLFKVIGKIFKVIIGAAKVVGIVGSLFGGGGGSHNEHTQQH